MKVAIIGSGIAGLGCAHALAGAGMQPTVFEAQERLGGHTNTVDVTLDGITHPVDTGFLVFNSRTYPQLIRLFESLGVPTAASDMSFAVSVGHGRRVLEWAGSDLNSVFAQRRNLGSPAFISMLADLLRFNRQARRIVAGAEDAGALTLGEFLARHRYGAALQRWYLLPMAAAIWSCPIRTMLGYPADTFLRFCHNHGLLQLTDRPPWLTVRGGARRYVEAIAARLADVRRRSPVRRVTRSAVAGKALVETPRGVERFDHVVLACHSDQSLRMLADAGDLERGVLAAVRYQSNRAVLHTDARLMPASRRVWSAWNYLSSGDDEPAVSVTYWLNKLQPLPFTRPVFVSLNPLIEPAPEQTIAEFDYAHPVFTHGAISAQQRLAEIQGVNRVWFAGAWTGYGFHEDGLRSGLAVADALIAIEDERHALAA